MGISGSFFCIFFVFLYSFLSKVLPFFLFDDTNDMVRGAYFRFRRLSFFSFALLRFRVFFKNK